MVVEGAWWDIVDACSRGYGQLLLAHPEPVASMMRRWSRDANLWKRRQSMICQLHLGADTDTVLLDEALSASLGDGGFSSARPWAGHCGNTPRPTPGGCGPGSGRIGSA